ncbi:protein-tyrosine phosphatase-like protein [Ostreococcus tauri]|uniref:protein-tyrosine-phosphatase n=2 Tax=Ostreococcus tauri TaxID=70448 RepID=A0A1Y5IMM9_OSTTA|nr:protein-tyrosine phosphatase-like protein [Ostreococcus tauri]
MRIELAAEAYVAVAALVDRELDRATRVSRCGPRTRRAMDETSSSAKATRDAKVRALFTALLTARSVREDATAVEVTEGVYVGSVGAARNARELRRMGVTHVLAVCDGAPAFSDDEGNGFIRATRAVKDSPEAPIEETFDFCYDFIRDARASGGRVLVHCFQGKSRSATICAMYMMRSLGMSYDEALEKIRAVRPCARPNSGFEKRLRALEKALAERARDGSPSKRRRRSPEIA